MEYMNCPECGYEELLRYSPFNQTATRIFLNGESDESDLYDTSDISIDKSKGVTEFCNSVNCNYEK